MSRGGGGGSGVLAAPPSEHRLWAPGAIVRAFDTEGKVSPFKGEDNLRADETGNKPQHSSAACVSAQREGVHYFSVFILIYLSIFYWLGTLLCRLGESCFFLQHAFLSLFFFSPPISRGS